MQRKMTCHGAELEQPSDGRRRVDLPLGVEVPEWVPKVAPASKAKPKDVQALGRTMQAKEIRWGRLAAEVGLSRQAQVLQNAAYNTKWRRMPAGRGRKGETSLTATSIKGGTSVGFLGRHLAEATLNLVAKGLHTRVNTWE